MAEVSPEYRAVSQDENDETLMDGEASPQDGPFRQQRYVSICECINAWFVYFRLHEYCTNLIQTMQCICENIGAVFRATVGCIFIVLFLSMLPHQTLANIFLSMHHMMFTHIHRRWCSEWCYFLMMTTAIIGGGRTSGTSAAAWFWSFRGLWRFWRFISWLNKL